VKVWCLGQRFTLGPPVEPVLFGLLESLWFPAIVSS